MISDNVVEKPGINSMFYALKILFNLTFMVQGEFSMWCFIDPTTLVSLHQTNINQKIHFLKQLDTNVDIFLLRGESLLARMF